MVNPNIWRKIRNYTLIATTAALISSCAMFKKAPAISGRSDYKAIAVQTGELDNAVFNKDSSFVYTDSAKILMPMPEVELKDVNLWETYQVDRCDSTLGPEEVNKFFELSDVNKTSEVREGDVLDETLAVEYDEDNIILIKQKRQIMEEYDMTTGTLKDYVNDPSFETSKNMQGIITGTRPLEDIIDSMNVAGVSDKGKTKGINFLGKSFAIGVTTFYNLETEKPSLSLSLTKPFALGDLYGFLVGTDINLYTPTLTDSDTETLQEFQIAGMMKGVDVRSYDRELQERVVATLRGGPYYNFGNVRFSLEGGVAYIVNDLDENTIFTREMYNVDGTQMPNADSPFNDVSIEDVTKAFAPIFQLSIGTGQFEFVGSLIPGNDDRSNIYGFGARAYFGGKGADE